ncbi:PAS domain S-box protein [Pseudalkalibacillus berkeleyi]|uniref:histidine kinase n=1 Tax=Pseudalkalibacillus berkeleyi TaxID=1069813 RepID=A0ABS9GZZ5_9BACL|nr:PAS domain S-box protein [Pseudalkalibacillus berkeleyi]MCF6137336.1 PAS domain S-box protein [Pseudalkalibacillus berkeleyi]
MYSNKKYKASNNSSIKDLLNSDMYKSLFDYNCDAIWAINLDGMILKINDAAKSMFKMKENQYLHTAINLWIEIDDETLFFDCLSSSKPHMFKGKLDTEELYITLEMTSIPIIIDSEIIGRFIQMKDRTIETREVDHMRSENAYWESFMNHSTDAIGLFDLDGNIIKLNRATEDIFLYSREELLGNKVITIPDESYRDEVEFLQRKVKSGKSVVEYETIRKRKDGKLIDVAITYSPLYDFEGNMIAMANILRDITERKNAENELRDREAKYRLIAENTADLIRVLDLNNTITYTSPSHTWMLGRDTDKYQYGDGFQFVHPLDHHHLNALYEEMLTTKQPLNIEFREQHASGEWIPLEARCMPVLDQNHNVTSVVMVIRDLSERKNTEELLRNSDKLAIIGQLAASIAHEIRNPLTSLKGFLQFFYSNGDELSRNYYELMLSEVERINLIVSEFLLLAKPQSSNFKETEINELFNHLLALVDSQAIMENVELSLEIDEEIPKIYGDSNQLKQVFLNYIKNAIEACSTGGQIDISVSTKLDMVEIKIKDNGSGIKEDHLNKIGTPFFTTKEKGTGLGLMISERIISNHKGTVRFESKEGLGTTVTIHIPYQKKA